MFRAGERDEIDLAIQQQSVDVDVRVGVATVVARISTSNPAPRNQWA
jgi:hypothetical protein